MRCAVSAQSGLGFSELSDNFGSGTEDVKKGQWVGLLWPSGGWFLLQYISIIHTYPFTFRIAKTV